MILIANHLWQSTLAALVAALLAFALRRNRAQVRYWLWLAASAKFLVPFALLVMLGNQFAWRTTSPAGADSAASIVIDAISQPFSPASVQTTVTGVPVSASSRALEFVPVIALGIWLLGTCAALLVWAGHWRRISAIVRRAATIEYGRELDILRRLESSDPHRRRRAGPLTLAASDGSLEPGVFGVRRPVLLWPTTISGRLTDEQIEAILAHELAHVRRRDNLAAALHMAAQAVFWFHPMVWWIGARLVDERERACDDEVLQQGSAPQVYAKSILKTCEFYAESPIACVSGVTGSDLKRRIEQIMRREAALALGGWRRALLVGVAVAAIGGPIAAGVFAAPAIVSQAAAANPVSRRFDVALIKRNESGRDEVSAGGSFPGQFVYSNVPLRSLISNAYGASLQPLSRDQLLAPEWIDSDRFDVLVKAEGDLQRFVDAGPGRPTEGPLPSMFRALLAERFNLSVHNERRDLPIYELVKAENDDQLGPQIRTAIADCRLRGRGAEPPPPPPPAPLPNDRPRCGIKLLAGNVSAGGVTMPQLANALSRLTGRVVVDMTELTGGFDLDLQWPPDSPAGGPAAARTGSKLFTALEEQLGLKLTPEIGPVDVVVVDRVEGLNRQDEFETPAVAPPPPPPLPPPGR